MSFRTDSGTKKIKKLTPKQQKFVDNIVSGKNPSEAYKEAYNAENFKENILLLKAYSNLVSPKTIVGYKKKRKSTVSQLDESVKCAVCKTNYAYCNHHIQLLINGGGNEDYNLIPICKS